MQDAWQPDGSEHPALLLSLVNLDDRIGRESRNDVEGDRKMCGNEWCGILFVDDK